MAHHLEDETTGDQGMVHASAPESGLPLTNPRLSSLMPLCQPETGSTSKKHSRYEGYEMFDGGPKRQRAEVFRQYSSDYHINHYGSGVFTFYRRGGVAVQVRDKPKVCH